jgi:chorismate dehydratase
MAEAVHNPVDTLGAVSFLNTRPLIEGLDDRPEVRVHRAVPAELPAMLEQGKVDAALTPVIDLVRNGHAWQRISNACIASDGETLTVRVFSRVPPKKITTLFVDTDSHTSIVLAKLVWQRWYKRSIEIAPLPDAPVAESHESVLLIGDKVITAPLQNYAFQIDLGAVWREWTGLPFVFAVWAAPVGHDHTRLAALLNDARDRGVAAAAEIARRAAPEIGWPEALAVEYLTRHIKYSLTVEAIKGMDRFISLATEAGWISQSTELVP